MKPDRGKVAVMENPKTRETHFLIGVFLMCMCGLMLQIMETRIGSIITYYHMAFFAIGIAMLGMTAGALLYITRSFLPSAPFQQSSRG